MYSDTQGVDNTRLIYLLRTSDTSQGNGGFMEIRILQFFLQSVDFFPIFVHIL